MAKAVQEGYSTQTDSNKKFHYLKRTVGLNTETSPEQFDATIQSYLDNGWRIQNTMYLGQFKDPMGNVLGDMFGVFFIRA